MKLNKKNKIILSASGVALLIGITYQNCGQINQMQTATDGKVNSESNLLKWTRLEATDQPKNITITLKDGTRINLNGGLKTQPKESK